MRGEVVYWPSVPIENDFIVEREDGRLDKIQVKYVSWKKHGRHHTTPYEHLHCRTYGWAGGRHKREGGPKYDYLFVVSEDGRQWEIPADKLPKDAVGIDTRGGKFKHKTAGKWDQYIVVRPLHDEKKDD